ncbi:unnamed protein product [Vitrella brassicaformis CCMP3155]|uniref:Uncharacterized protein n=1 Tax=Vitrella brassicaformis (strain CCMP3155) TaxID=1169540 RepID=A0A0G4EY81_VITBC|nr:unnamed protein product [Vitrella brassicaformis CCMP3155]|eukprot:CEM03395.1 unnamed protein product [Vitrella brassicaformis CCMP3155]
MHTDPTMLSVERRLSQGNQRQRFDRQFLEARKKMEQKVLLHLERSRRCRRIREEADLEQLELIVDVELACPFPWLPTKTLKDVWRAYDHVNPNNAALSATLADAKDRLQAKETVSTAVVKSLVESLEVSIRESEMLKEQLERETKTWKETNQTMASKVAQVESALQDCRQLEEGLQRLKDTEIHQLCREHQEVVDAKNRELGAAGTKVMQKQPKNQLQVRRLKGELQEADATVRRLENRCQLLELVKDGRYAILPPLDLNVLQKQFKGDSNDTKKILMAGQMVSRLLRLPYTEQARRAAQVVAASILPSISEMEGMSQEERNGFIEEMIKQRAYESLSRGASQASASSPSDTGNGDWPALPTSGGAQGGARGIGKEIHRRLRSLLKDVDELPFAVPQPSVYADIRRRIGIIIMWSPSSPQQPDSQDETQDTNNAPGQGVTQEDTHEEDSSTTPSSSHDRRKRRNAVTPKHYPETPDNKRRSTDAEGDIDSETDGDDSDMVMAWEAEGEEAEPSVKRRKYIPVV